MEYQHTLINVNNCLYTNIYPYLETSCAQSSDLYLNVVHFSKPMLIRHMWQLKDSCFPALLSNTCSYNFNCNLFLNISSVKNSSFVTTSLSLYFFQTLAGLECEPRTIYDFSFIYYDFNPEPRRLPSKNCT